MRQPTLRSGAVLLMLLLAGASSGPAVRVGSKAFTESILLGAIATGRLQAAGIEASHEKGLGGTRILWRGLIEGSIDLYPEYSGTLWTEILGRSGSPDDSLATALAAQGVRISAPLGFNNTYALGMLEARAAALGIRRLSDLRDHPELVLGLSHEFMNRDDGWPGLRAAYALPHQGVRGLDHDLAYRALGAGSIDLTDLYSTDAEIASLGLRVLEDDATYFPDYQAVFVYRADLATRRPEAAAALGTLAGRFDAATMVELNRRARLDRVPEDEVAAAWLDQTFGNGGAVRAEGRAARIARRTGEHLALVSISLLAAILVAVPLGVLAARRPRLGAVVLAGAGLLQTIPSLALLVFLIPLLGIGTPPAVVALFLYSLLPIVRNLHAGLTGIPVGLAESARALGLPAGARLWHIELPLASPALLAGIQTSAVINVGTATLGALIGAGGYGQPILTGVRLDDVGLILEGALPAAGLALLVQGGFALLGRRIIPRGLRLRPLD